MNLKGYGRNRIWPGATEGNHENINQENQSWVENSARNLQNMKQECQPLDCGVHCLLCRNCNFYPEDGGSMYA
jgi:hypothetical protein